MDKFNAIMNYLMNEGNYDFPFNKYVESVQLKTGMNIHPFVYFCEYFYDDPMFPDSDERMSYDEFAHLVKSSPDFDPDDPFIWFGDDRKLHSAKHIFPDICNASDVASWCIVNNDDLDYDDTIHDILNREEN